MTEKYQEVDPIKIMQEAQLPPQGEITALVNGYQCYGYDAVMMSEGKIIELRSSSGEPTLHVGDNVVLKDHSLIKLLGLNHEEPAVIVDLFEPSEPYKAGKNGKAGTDHVVMIEQGDKKELIPPNVLKWD